MVEVVRRREVSLVERLSILGEETLLVSFDRIDGQVRRVGGVVEVGGGRRGGMRVQCAVVDRRLLRGVSSIRGWCIRLVV